MDGFDPTESQALEASQAWLAIEHHDGTREHVRLSLALTTVGRSEQNVIEMLDPKLSRFHSEIERSPDGYQVRDCNSRNGTLINGDPVSERGVPLSNGDRIKIGRTLMTFHTRRPPELRSDRVVPLPTMEVDGTTEALTHTPHMAQRRPTQASYDTRNTQAVEALDARNRNPWQLLALASREVLRATHRRELQERAVDRARQFFESKGALIALGQNPDELSITASAGVEKEQQADGLHLAARALVAMKPIDDDRRMLAVPLRAEKATVGALVLVDLNSAPFAESKELEVFLAFAEVVAHTLTTSLMIEEVRREERAAGARRIAQDLRAVLRPPTLESPSGLLIARVTTRGDQVERSFWDRVVAPARAGREEIYLALGDVPAPDAPAPRKLRRKGERAFVSLLGQAELRGALRSLIEVLPRTSDLLAQLDGALRREASVDQASLILSRYDTRSGSLRFAGAGHAPVLIRRAGGEVESLESIGPALGVEGGTRTSERDLKLERDDQVLFVTLGALRMERQTPEPLTSLFARLGGPGLDPEVIAQRIAEALVEQSVLATHEGFTLLLLRKT